MLSTFAVLRKTDPSQDLPECDNMWVQQNTYRHKAERQKEC